MPAEVTTMRVGLIGAEIEENLAMRCIAASLRAAGHETRIFDFHERGQIAEVAAAVADWAPGLVGAPRLLRRPRAAALLP